MSEIDELNGWRFREADNPAEAVLEITLKGRVAAWLCLTHEELLELSEGALTMATRVKPGKRIGVGDVGYDPKPRP